MAHAWTICREVDLARDFVGVERIAALATTSAKAAHELHIAVKSGGEPIGMDGASVLLNLILPDGVSTTADGRIEAGACIAMLPSLCYQRGETRGVLLLQFGTQAAIPVYAFVLRCFEDLTDAFADPDHVIPSLAELLAQLDAAKNAAKAAQDGASAANAAAGAANAAAGNANKAANTANTAATHANAAKDEANAAAERLDGLTATATGLDAGSAPTVDVTQNEDGTRVLAFGIPRGATGATPNLTVNVATGDPGTQASVAQSGTAENPVLLLKIPKGDTGDIGALKINGKAPDSSGTVTLDAGDVGAATAEALSSLKDDKLDKTATAADSSKLGGQQPAYYATASELGNKANKADVLTYEEIQASTDLSGKIASASGLKYISTKVYGIDSPFSIGYSAESNEVSFIPRNVGIGVFLIFAFGGYNIVGLLLISEQHYNIFYVRDVNEVITSYGGLDDTVTVGVGGWYVMLQARKIA